MSESSAAVSTQSLDTGDLLVNSFNVAFQYGLVLEEFPTEVTGHCVEVNTVALHHVALQCCVRSETPPTGLAKQLLHFKLTNDLHKLRIIFLVWMETEQVSTYFGG